MILTPRQVGSLRGSADGTTRFRFTHPLHSGNAGLCDRDGLRSRYLPLDRRMLYRLSYTAKGGTADSPGIEPSGACRESFPVTHRKPLAMSKPSVASLAHEFRP